MSWYVLTCEAIVCEFRYLSLSAFAIIETMVHQQVFLRAFRSEMNAAALEDELYSTVADKQDRPAPTCQWL